MSDRIPHHFQRLTVTGYRGLENRVDVNNIATIAVIYGLNNTGKTNLLRAAGLIDKLIHQPLARLLDDTQENLRTFLDRIGEDRWMFANDGNQVTLGCTFTGGCSLEFVITQFEGGANAVLSSWVKNGADQLVELRAVFEALRASQASPEGNESIAKRFEVFRVGWSQLQHSITVHYTTQSIPVKQPLRDDLAARLRSSNLKDRTRAAKLISLYSSCVAGLPAGSLVEFSDEGRNDFAWLTNESIVPLDHLGSGAQALFALLATFTNDSIDVLLIDEPESHLNNVQQHQLYKALLGARTELGIDQVIIATHSALVAQYADDLRVLERSSKDVPRRTPQQIPGLEARTGTSREEPVSMLAHDFTVEVPEFVRTQLDVSPGQFLYFVRRGERVELASEAQTLAGLES